MQMQMQIEMQLQMQIQILIEIEMTFALLAEGGQPLQWNHICLGLLHSMETITSTFSKTSKGQSCSVLQRRFVVFNF